MHILRARERGRTGRGRHLGRVRADAGKVRRGDRAGILQHREHQRRAEALPELGIDTAANARSAELVTGRRAEVDRDTARRQRTRPHHEQPSLPLTDSAGILAENLRALVEHHDAAILGIDILAYDAGDDPSLCRVDRRRERAGDGPSRGDKEIAVANDRRAGDLDLAALELRAEIRRTTDTGARHKSVSCLRAALSTYERSDHCACSLREASRSVLALRRAREAAAKPARIPHDRRTPRRLGELLRPCERGRSVCGTDGSRLLRCAIGVGGLPVHQRGLAGCERLTVRSERGPACGRGGDAAVQRLVCGVLPKRGLLRHRSRGPRLLLRSLLRGPDDGVRGQEQNRRDHAAADDAGTEQHRQDLTIDASASALELCVGANGIAVAGDRHDIIGHYC